MGGSSQLWNGGLRALEEAWDDFLLEAFFCQVWCQVWSFSVLLGRLWVAPGGVDLRSCRFQEVKGSQELQNGGLRALEKAWDVFLLEALFCHVWLFSVLMGRLWVVPGGVDLRSCRFQEVKGSQELQNCSLRANS